jgi:5-methyltetrahydrofolate--homocysteine methyltransferase
MLKTIYWNVVDGNAPAVVKGVQEALEAGLGPGEILNEGMIAAMAEVGRRFEDQECFVPELLIAARAMQKGVVVLRPYLVEADIEPVGKVVLGTVSGDLHDIGKNLVGMMLEGTGFEVIDLGVDVSPDKFVEAAQEHHPHFVGLSVLLTTTMSSMQATVKKLQEAGLQGSVKVMVGGAPVTQGFADEIGADLYAPDASAAASRARSMLTG